MEKTKLENIVKIGTKLNYQWIQDNPNHHLSKEFAPNLCDHGEGIETCCEITANTVSKEMGITNWKRTNLEMKDALALQVPLRIEMGFFDPDFVDLVDSPNHVLIIAYGFMIDSFFQERSITMFPMNTDLTQSFEENNFIKISHLGRKVKAYEVNGWEMRIYVPL